MKIETKPFKVTPEDHRNTTLALYNLENFPMKGVRDSFLGLILPWGIIALIVLLKGDLVIGLSFLLILACTPVIIIGCIVYLIFGFVTLRSLKLKVEQLRQNGQFDSMLICFFDEGFMWTEIDGIEVNKKAWNEFKRVRKNSEYYLFLHHVPKNTYAFIPVNAFKSLQDEALFQTIIQENRIPIEL